MREGRELNGRADSAVIRQSENAGRRSRQQRGRGGRLRSWILTGIQGGHEQREPGQLILHRCFHVPDRSRRRVSVCAAPYGEVLR